MKCMNCGFQSPAPFSVCPSCGAVQLNGQPVSTVSPYSANYANLVHRPKHSGGETAAIVIAITVSAISVIAAFFIFIGFMSYVGTRTIKEDDYGIDAFNDFDSDEYSDDFEEFFKDDQNEKGIGSLKSPAGLHTPLLFSDKLYSFSEGQIETEYEVSMTETYRGEAALKLLEGAALPIYNEDQYDIYLVRFNVRITKQEKDAIVTFPINFPGAYPADAVSLFSGEYTAIDQLDYVNKYALISKGETLETWVAFIVDKNDRNPNILWNKLKKKVFRNNDEAVSDPAAVEAGAAIHLEEKSSSEESVAATSSDSESFTD